MIHAVLIFNNQGKPRFSKFFSRSNTENEQKIIKDTFQIVSRRRDSQCNVVEGNQHFKIPKTFERFGGRVKIIAI